MPNLVKKVQNTIFQHDLFQNGQKIVVGVSGGPDSVSLLDILAKLQRKYSLELIIAHVNYGLRGKDSDEDEKLVRKLAEKYGIEIYVLNWVEAPRRGVSARDKKQLSENHLRDIRYDFFEKIREKNKFDLIAVAHNADDQAETFLMRVIRGAGMEGLSSMQFKNKRIIRPLLPATRSEIVRYLKENNLAWRIDKTNLETKFLRNKIRNKLIPYLEKNFNPAIKKTIFDSTLSIALDQDFISVLVEKSLDNTLDLKISKLLSLHPAIQKRVLRGAILRVKSDLKNIDSSHIEEIIKIAKSTKNKAQIAIFKGLKVSRKNDRLIIEKLSK